MEERGRRWGGARRRRGAPVLVGGARRCVLGLLFPEQRCSGLFSFPGMFLRFADDLLGDDRAMARTLAGDQRPGLAGFLAGDSASSSPAMISHALITSMPDSGLGAGAGFLASGTTRGGGRLLDARFHSRLIGFSCSCGNGSSLAPAVAVAPCLICRSRTP